MSDEQDIPARLPLPPGVKTETTLPRVAATFCMLCCLTVAMMGISRLRDTTEAYPSLLDSVLFLGESRWDVQNSTGQCIAKLHLIVSSSESRYRVNGQFTIPGAESAQLIVELLFSTYRLLDGIQLDANFPDQIISMNSQDEGLTLGYRKLTMPEEIKDQSQNPISLAKKESGSLAIPQPILLVDTGSEGRKLKDSFRISFPPILNRYLAASGEDPIRIVPEVAEECEGEEGTASALNTYIHDAIAQFELPGSIPKEYDDDPND